MGSRSRRSSSLLTSLVAVLSVAAVLSINPVAACAATVVLHAYDEAGTLLSTQAFLDRTSAAPKGWRNDLTYLISDGTAVAHTPIYDLAGLPALDIAAGGTGLAVAWSTENAGYSTLLLDNLGAGLAAGTVVFNDLAARDVRAKLDAARARRPAFVPSAAYTALDNEANALLVAAAGAGTESERGRLAQEALDRLIQAFEVLLHDHGLQRARSAPLGEWWGVTVDRVNNYPSVLASVSDLVENVAGRAVVRIVFDEGVAAVDYDAIVAAAQAAGLRVMGQILDSFAMSSYTQAGFEARVREYVDHFPQIDLWEIGNEVNGEWLGAGVAAKIAYAADYVKTKDPSDTTVLTFYWQMGTAGGASTTLFQWIADNVGAALRADTDVVALSTWIGDAPLGVAHDEVYERLHALFPAQRIVMGELGYWSQGTTKAWWWRSQVDPTGAVRRALAEQMYLANLSFDYSDGGVFWWYYYDEMSGGGPLWDTVNEAYRSIYFCDDADADGACDFQDNCPADANADQADTDDDGVGDVCDLLCPIGDAVELSRLNVDLRDGAADRLTIKGTLVASASFDPVADGVRLRVESASDVLVDTDLGGPGAPAPFVENNGSFRYKDPIGAASGIRSAQLKALRGTLGGYRLTIKGKNMTIPAPSAAQARLLLDLRTTCAETHASAVTCTLDAAATKLRCY
ncbi:MAG: hypothetical protein HY899_04005 [Deltaproteobacteria bacterium]|nr:hypothetical protein [Deltaproteobacteria bacterium]